MPQDLFAETLAIAADGELAERRCGALSGGRAELMISEGAGPCKL
jgi:hypothetical protein